MLIFMYIYKFDIFVDLFLNELKKIICKCILNNEIRIRDILREY